MARRKALSPSWARSTAKPSRARKSRSRWHSSSSSSASRIFASFMQRVYKRDAGIVPAFTSFYPKRLLFRRYRAQRRRAGRVACVVGRQALHQRQQCDGERDPADCDETELIEQARVDRQAFQRICEILRNAREVGDDAAQILRDADSDEIRTHHEAAHT